MSVATGEAGPVIILSGEADVSNAAQLREVITAQLASGTLYLTIDAAELSFADSMSIGVLAGAARTLRGLGGALVLLHPQKSLIRTLTLLGADQVMTIYAATDITPQPDNEARDTPLELAQEQAGPLAGEPGPQPHSWASHLVILRCGPRLGRRQRGCSASPGCRSGLVQAMASHLGFR